MRCIQMRFKFKEAPLTTDNLNSFLKFESAFDRNYSKCNKNTKQINNF